MRGLIWLGSVILMMGLCGCDKTPDFAVLKQQFLNAEKRQADRVAAGRLLLHDIEGKIICCCPVLDAAAKCGASTRQFIDTLTARSCCATANGIDGQSKR